MEESIKLESTGHGEGHGDGDEGRTERPWGWFEGLGSGEGHRVKRLWIRPGARISLQRHAHRVEHWVVVAGAGVLESNGERLEAVEGTTLFIPQGAIHRASAGKEGLEIIEVQRGAVLQEEDIERFEDDFGRVPS
jgi:mannose-6-phosphate isomerase-like protein (cupin superfamily)